MLDPEILRQVLPVSRRVAQRLEVLLRVAVVHDQRVPHLIVTFFRAAADDGDAGALAARRATRAAASSVRNSGNASRGRDDESEEPGAAHPHKSSGARVTWPLQVLLLKIASFCTVVVERSSRQLCLPA